MIGWRGRAVKFGLFLSTIELYKQKSVTYGVSPRDDVPLMMYEGAHMGWL